MQCLSIPIQNPDEFKHSAWAGLVMFVSSAHHYDDCVCALETSASSQIQRAGEIHYRNTPLLLGLTAVLSATIQST